MEFLIDSANIDEIKKIYDIFPIDGVTTNPSILKKEGKDPLKQLYEIRNSLPRGAQLHIQVVSRTAEEIIREAEAILSKFGNDTFIKIPVSDEGIKAIKALSARSISTTATAVFAPMQGFVAAKAGAKYIAPYINRLDNMDLDGIGVAKNIHDMIKTHNLPAKVLAASLKTTQQILALCLHSIPSITASPDVLKQLIDSKITSSAIDSFTLDFESLAGRGKTMLDLINP